MSFFVMNTLIVSTTLSLWILGPLQTQAGFGSGPGTDPFGFGNVSESCKLPLFQSQNFVANWDNLVPFHFLMMSKEHLTRLTQRLYGSLVVPDIAQEEINEGCFVLHRFPRPIGRHHEVTGFGDKFLEMKVYPLGIPGLSRSDVLVDGDSGGVAALALSDNVSFNLGVFCWDDGVGTWLVSSPRRKLSSKNVYLIQQHLLSLGFDGSNFLSVDYSRCPHEEAEHEVQKTSGYGHTTKHSSGY